MKKSLFIVLLILIQTPATGNQAPYWEKIEVSIAPPGRFHHSMAYDSNRKKVVLFGGNVDGWIGNDTWEFDTSSQTWEKIITPVSPPGLNYHAMSFDSTHNVVILFGGVIDRGTQQNSTWVYNGTTWVDMKPLNAPSIRRGHSMVYDPLNDRTILFGGIARKDGRLQPVNDTWVYDYSTNTWTELNVSSAPSPRHTAAMAYDMDSAKIFLYGGNTGYHSGHNTDTWMFDYSTLTWKEMSPPNNPSPPRGDFDMAYAPPLKSMVLYGGYNKTHNFGDTWLYNTLENNWSKLEIKGPLGRGTDGSLEYIEQGILLFGGFTDKGENETWIFSLPEAVTTSSTSSSSSLVTSSTLTTSEQSTSAPDIQGSTVSKTLFAFPFISLILLRRKNEKW